MNYASLICNKNAFEKVSNARNVHFYICLNVFALDYINHCIIYIIGLNSGPRHDFVPLKRHEVVAMASPRLHARRSAPNHLSVSSTSQRLVPASRVIV